MTDLPGITGTLTGVRVEEVSLPGPFMDTAARFVREPGTVLLLSGTGLDCARYDFLAAHPYLTFSSRGAHSRIVAKGHSRDIAGDPLETLRGVLRSLDLPDAPEGVPCAAGLFGYLAYDLKDAIEELPRTCVNDLHLPDILLHAPRILLVRDRVRNTTRLCLPLYAGSDDPDGEKALAAFNAAMDGPLPEKGTYGGDAEALASNFTREAYMEAVARVREYIAAGDVYQVNMSQRFSMPFEGDAFALFQDLFAANPAPFFAFINAGDHQVVSTSPERFLKLDSGRVESRPIKGTRPRGATPAEDALHKAALLGSKKDDAELSMIVDLIRNDIGRACTGGSVRVEQHKRIEAYTNVWHLVSIVTGDLKPGCDAADLIRATFPGGSITGCPKIRSMEIIDELETVRRHIYTGSIGYIGLHGTMDLSIAIRTATITRGRIVFSVGGGIVFDSDPADEFDETLHKGRTFLQALKGSDTPPGHRPFAWFNGGIIPQDAAAIPLDDPGAQYGYGFFETIRVQDGRPVLLAEHLARFETTWKALFPGPVPDLTWPEVLRQVLAKNRLLSGPAALKILATRGTGPDDAPRPRLAVTARTYAPRPAIATHGGLRLITYPEPRQSPLADHKTLNYLYYLLAGRFAAQKGTDEAVILNPDGSISETNTANLIVLKGDTALSPASPHVLPGVTAAAARGWFHEEGFQIAEQPLLPGDLYDADEVLLFNSLMGATPAVSLDGRNLPRPSGRWKRFNEQMFGKQRTGD